MKEIRLAISEEIMELVDYAFGEEFQFDEFTYYVDNLMDIADFAMRLHGQASVPRCFARKREQDS